jgi:hypothetical protein
MPAAAPTNGRKVLQATAAPGGACGANAKARCPSTQCYSQNGWCGVTAAHCNSMCQATWSASNSNCRGGAAPPPTPRTPAAPQPPAQPPSRPPTQPPAPTGATSTSTGVSYHLYEGVSFPAIPSAGAAAQTLPGSNPGYNINNLYVSTNQPAGCSAFIHSFIHSCYTCCRSSFEQRQPIPNAACVRFLTAANHFSWQCRMCIACTVLQLAPLQAWKSSGLAAK